MAYFKGIANPTIQKHGYTIAFGFRITKTGTKAKPYKLDLGVRYHKGKKKHPRPTFATLEEAKNMAQLKRVEADRLGNHSLAFTDAMRMDALKALETLKPFGITLSECANYFAKHETEVDYNESISALVDVFIENKKASGLREASIQGYKKTLCSFVEAFSDRSPQSVTHLELDKFLSAWNNSPTSREHRHTSINTFFRYLLKQGIIGTNPMSKVDKKAKLTNRKQPHIFNSEKALMILEQAADAASEKTIEWTASSDRYSVQKAKYKIPIHQPYDLFLYLAVGFLSGIRPKEILRLKWEDIDLNQKHIVISADQSKERKPRVVEIYPRLLDLLINYRESHAVDSSGMLITISENSIKNRRTKLMKSVGIRWKQDVMRHTFATYHIAKFGIDNTRQQLGHTVDQVMFDYYIGYAKNAEKEAEVYFNHLTKIKKLDGNKSLAEG